MNKLTNEERVKINQAFSNVLNEMKKHGLPDIALIRKAFLFAVDKHGNARRKTGEPYILHPIEVAQILAETGHESDMIASAILHDVVEDCDVPLKKIEEEFGASIADTVDAVTKVSRMFSSDPEISKNDLDVLSDIKFLTAIFEKHNRKAVYIKCADRIHNLRTIHIFSEEKQRAKAYHTRRVIIPAAKKLHIHKLVDVLGTLCLKIENPQAYADIQEKYEEIIKKNKDTLLGNKGLIESTTRMIMDDSRNGRHVAAFKFVKRCEDSIFMDISAQLDNFHNLKGCFTKKNVPLYDVYFITKDTYDETPETLFFNMYDKLHESKYKFTVTGVEHLDDSDVLFYKMSDRFGTKYRLFIQSETEHLEFAHGILVSEEMKEFRDGMHVNEAEPDEPLHKMIPVFKKDGTPMMIEQGATVLDFAFAIDRNIGICAKYAFLNGSKTQTPIYQRLKPGDMVEVVADHDKKDSSKDVAHATVRWFEYVHTREATRALSRWLEKNMDSATPKMLVSDGEGNEYEIEIASTVLDFAFVIGEKVGLHVQKAFINKSTEPAELDTRLKYGDRVKFEFDETDEGTPVFTWLSIVRTKLAKERLVAYFNKRYYGATN